MAMAGGGAVSLSPGPTSPDVRAAPRDRLFRRSVEAVRSWSGAETTVW